MRDTFHCPRCNRLLRRAGEVTVDAQPAGLDYFQCDECLDTWTVQGQPFEVAFSFAVDDHGRVLHPETLEPLD